MTGWPLGLWANTHPRLGGDALKTATIPKRLGYWNPLGLLHFSVIHGAVKRCPRMNTPSRGLSPRMGGAQPGRGAGTREARQPHAPWVCRSASSRNWASFWIRCSLPSFPIPKSRRVVRENRRMSFQVGPSLKIIPKEEGTAEQLLPPRRAGARGRQRGTRGIGRGATCPPRPAVPVPVPLTPTPSGALAFTPATQCRSFSTLPAPPSEMDYASQIFPVC